MVWSLRLGKQKQATADLEGDNGDADVGADDDEVVGDRQARDADKKHKHHHHKKSSKKDPDEPPRREAAPLKDAKQPSGGSRSALTVNEFVARTKRCREKGLEPTKPELIAYARYLGIDPITDADLMWIVDESLNAPLPSEWTEHHDSSNRVFYYNVDSQASSWTHPLEQLHRDTYKNIVEFRSGNMSKEEQFAALETMRRRVEEDERDAHRELQAWSEYEDDQGQKFYCNRERQCSVWTDPRPARCHSLYLQMKALRMLSKHCGQPISPRDKRPMPQDLGMSSRNGKGVQQTPPGSSGPRAQSREQGSGAGGRGGVRAPSRDHASKNRLGSADRSHSNTQADDLSEHRGLEDGSFETGNRGRRKKKNNRGDLDSGGASQDEVENPMPNRNKILSMESSKTGTLTSTKSASVLSVVEDSRHTLSNSSTLPALNGTGGGLPCLPGLGPSVGGGASGRPPSRPGESGTIGVKKARAGIRLEPLKRGADLL